MTSSKHNDYGTSPYAPTSTLLVEKNVSGRLRWEGPSSTTGSFDPGDVLFIEENPFGDFSSAAWEGATLSSEFIDLHSWLNTSFMSSPEQCYELEDLYERCLAKVRQMLL